MSRSDVARLFDQLDSLTVGFAPLFRDFHLTTPNYPPHNIITLDENRLRLEVAVAGFKKDEVQMQEHQGLLTISGTKKVKEGESYQHQGIANRSFSKSFRVAEYFEVEDANLEDGILTVNFVKNVPEEAKPKLIAIK